MSATEQVQNAEVKQGRRQLQLTGRVRLKLGQLSRIQASVMAGGLTDALTVDARASTQGLIRVQRGLVMRN